MDKLNRDQIDLVAQSIALHASGATGASGHLAEFNVKTVEELATRIEQTLSSPKTQFMVNNSLSPNNSGAIVAFNREQHSILILNPNLLNDPRQSDGQIVPVQKGSPDNLAGTYYNMPKLDTNGNPILQLGETADSQFNKSIQTLRTRTSKDLNAYPPSPGKTYTLDDVPVKSMGESDEIAQWVSRNEPRIRDGLAKATQRIESGAYVTQSIRDNVLKHGANGNLDLAVTDETRALSIHKALLAGYFFLVQPRLFR